MSDYPDIGNGAVTPGRKTRVRFDVADTVVAEQPYGLIRRYSEIAVGQSADVQACVLIPGVGWQLKPFNWNIGTAQEDTRVQPKIMRSVADGGSLAVPSGLLSFPTQRASDLAGATAGAGAHYSTQGDSFYRIFLGAADTLGTAAYSLLADVTAFPGPNVSANIPPARIICDSVPHDPNTPFSFRVISTGSSNNVPDQIGSVCFAGPASYDAGRFRGYGQWCLVLFGDGQCWLYEQGYDIFGGALIWRRQKVARWTQPQRVSGASHRIYVHPHIYKTKQGDRIGSIWIQTDGSEQTTPSPGISGHGLPSDQETSSFRHYVRANGTPSPQSCPIRVDVRADHRLSVQLAYMKYPLTGYILDDPFGMFQLPKYTSKITVQWFGDVPTGCGIAVELDDSNGTAMAASGAPTGNSTGGEAAFTVNPAISTYRVRITLVGSGDLTPTLYEYRIEKDGFVVTSAPGEFLGRMWTRFSGVGPDAEPSSESARATIEDPSNNLAILRARTSIHSLIDTQYTGVDWTDPANEGKQSVIAGGYSQRQTATKKGRQLMKAMGSAVQSLFPSQNWFSYDCDFAAEYTRLIEAQCPYWDFGWDPDAPPAADNAQQPYKATDALWFLMLWAGFPVSMIGFGPGTGPATDLNLRLFPKAGEDGGFAINYGTSVLQVAQRIARDYLGAVLFFDRNAGTGTNPTLWKGMWRLILPKYAPYRNLAYFATTVPAGGAGPVKLGHTIGAWPDTADPSGTGQMMKGGPILAGSYRSYVIPPEANLVTVSGTGDLSLANNPDMLTVTAVNLKSFDFIPGHVSSDPTSPDYLGRLVPLIVVDPNIATPEAAAWYCRRLYDVTAHAKKVIQFVAPLVLVKDTSEPNAQRPRPLRYYDAVQVNGQQFLVRSCNPFYVKDSKQLAMYEVEAPTAPFS